MTTETKVRVPICKHCGSTEVKRDAYASWDIESQSWVLHDTYDYTHCSACDGQTSIEYIEYSNVRCCDSCDCEYAIDNLETLDGGDRRCMHCSPEE
jgi:hypothetical protein